MGKGLGGGTNVFGLQYIDQSELINKDFGENKWSYKNWEKEFEEVNNIIKPEKYDYEKGPNENWKNLYNEISKEKTDNVLLHNNNLYGKNLDNIDTSKRLILGNILNELDNIDVVYDVRIKNCILKIMKLNMQSVLVIIYITAIK